MLSDALDADAARAAFAAVIDWGVPTAEGAGQLHGSAASAVAAASSGSAVGIGGGAVYGRSAIISPSAAPGGLPGIGVDVAVVVEAGAAIAAVAAEKSVSAALDAYGGGGI